jgi:hypothetical protein
VLETFVQHEEKRRFAVGRKPRAVRGRREACWHAGHTTNWSFGAARCHTIHSARRSFGAAHVSASQRHPACAFQASQLRRSALLQRSQLGVPTPTTSERRSDPSPVDDLAVRPDTRTATPKAVTACDAMRDHQ